MPDTPPSQPTTPKPEEPVRYFRKVIKIRAEDSPNVQRGLWMQAQGLQPDGRVVLPGVMPWDDYIKRRTMWDPVRQCIGLDAEFWEGADTLLFPPHWLNLAEQRAAQLATSGVKRRAEGLGVDPGEGSSKTTMCVVDKYGIIELTSKLTPDTTVVRREAIMMMRRWGLKPEQVCFDRGGGGKQHADQLRLQGYQVRTVAFGETVNPEPRRGMVSLNNLRDEREDRYAYFNRRAELYGTLRNLLDPAENPSGFGLPAEYAELRRQLSLIPLIYDQEGRLVLPPKSQRPSLSGNKSQSVTLTSIIGHSPDEADAVVLAVHAMLVKGRRVVAGPL